MYTCYVFYLYFFQCTSRCAYFGGKNIKIRWKLTALWIFYLCYIPSVFWPQHGSYKLLGPDQRHRPNDTWAIITAANWRQKMNHWTSHHMFILRRNNWWSRCHRPTAIIVERRQQRTKEAKVWEKGKEESEGIDDLLMHAVIPSLYKQYWEYLHESFCMWLRIVIIISMK